MKTKNIFNNTLPLLFVACLFIAACKGDKYHFLQDEDMDWMVYSNGQQLVFKNASGQSRKYTVYNVYRGYVTDQGSHDEHVRVAMDLSAIANPNLNYARLEIIKRSGGLDVIVSWCNFNVSKFINKITPVKDTILNKPYTDIYILDNPLADTLENNVERVKYSRSKGHVQFIETNGTVWSRTY